MRLYLLVVVKNDRFVRFWRESGGDLYNQPSGGGGGGEMREKAQLVEVQV